MPSTRIPRSLAPRLSTVAAFALKHRYCSVSEGGELMALANQLAAAEDVEPIALPHYWGGNERPEPCVFVAMSRDTRLRLSELCGRVAYSVEAVTREDVYEAGSLCRDWLRYDARNLNDPVVTP